MNILNIIFKYKNVESIMKVLPAIVYPLTAFTCETKTLDIFSLNYVKEILTFNLVM